MTSPRAALVPLDRSNPNWGRTLNQNRVLICLVNPRLHFPAQQVNEPVATGASYLKLSVLA